MQRQTTAPAIGTKNTAMQVAQHTLPHHALSIVLKQNTADTTRNSVDNYQYRREKQQSNRYRKGNDSTIDDTADKELLLQGSSSV